MPYMFTSCGDCTPCRCAQGFRLAGDNASPPKITTRSDNSASLCTCDSCKNAEGVWFNTVTRSLASSSYRATGSRLIAAGTTTSRPPYNSGPQISHTEKSNAHEWNNVHTSRSLNSKRDWLDANKRLTLACVIIAPFGRPVVPEV